MVSKENLVWIALVISVLAFCFLNAAGLYLEYHKKHHASLATVSEEEDTLWIDPVIFEFDSITIEFPRNRVAKEVELISITRGSIGVLDMDDYHEPPPYMMVEKSFPKDAGPQYAGSDEGLAVFQEKYPDTGLHVKNNVGGQGGFDIFGYQVKFGGKISLERNVSIEKRK